MSANDVLRFGPMRAAGAALVLALGFASWALADAFRTPTVAPATARQASIAPLAPPQAPASIDVDAAVDGDLFAPDRSAPDTPFRMPGEGAPARSDVVPVQRPTVLGTAVAADGASFATAQLAGGTPRIIRRGDQLGEYTVASISRGHVLFTASTGTRLDIAATAAPTQESTHAFNTPAPFLVDSSNNGYGGYGARPVFGRGAARRGGRARPDTLPDH